PPGARDRDADGRRAVSRRRLALPTFAESAISSARFAPGLRGSRSLATARLSCLASSGVEAKLALDAIAKELADSHLNAHPEFAGRNTSAENIAHWFAERLDSSGTLAWTRVAEVTVWEGPENRATPLPPRR